MNKAELDCVCSRVQAVFADEFSKRGWVPDGAGRVVVLEDALQTSTSMLEALLVQLNSWGHSSAVDARGQIMRNEALLEQAK